MEIRSPEKQVDQPSWVWDGSRRFPSRIRICQAWKSRLRRHASRLSSASVGLRRAQATSTNAAGPPRSFQPSQSGACPVRCGDRSQHSSPTDRRLSGHGRACRSCPHARRCNRRAKSFDADCRRGLSCGALWHLGDFTELVLRLTKISTAVPPPFRRAASKSARPRRDTRPQ